MLRYCHHPSLCLVRLIQSYDSGDTTVLLSTATSELFSHLALQRGGKQNGRGAGRMHALITLDLLLLNALAQ